MVHFDNHSDDPKDGGGAPSSGPAPLDVAPPQGAAPGFRALDGGPTTGSAALSGRHYAVLGFVLVAMIGAAVAGWVYAGLPPGEASDRARLAVLPFSDPDSEEAADFNRALAGAFVVALTNADPDRVAVIGPATTGRMLLAGLTPAEIAANTDADFILLGGHREADHVTFVQVLAASGAEHVFARQFEIDESQPAHAPAEVVGAIVEAINTASEASGGGQG